MFGLSKSPRFSKSSPQGVAALGDAEDDEAEDPPFSALLLFSDGIFNALANSEEEEVG
jgi:hypothetical protein